MSPLDGAREPVASRPSVVLRSSGSPPGRGVRGPAHSHLAEPRAYGLSAPLPRHGGSTRPQRQANPGGQLAAFSGAGDENRTRMSSPEVGAGPSTTLARTRAGTRHQSIPH